MSVDKELINEAASALTLLDIGLFGAHITVSDKYHPSMSGGLDEVNISFRHFPKSLASVKVNGAPQGQNLWRYLYETEVQVIKTIEGSTEEPLFSQEATFFADYAVSEERKTTERCFHEFGRCNVGFQIWPYWREYFASSLIRCGFPSIQLPMYNLKTVPTEIRMNLQEQLEQK
jgi:hypothetical protein